MSQSRESLILVRTRALDREVRRFATDLRQASGCDVRFILDERNAIVRLDNDEVVSLNRVSLEALGIFVPHDVGWRCGDYGLYIACRQYPSYDHYWVMDDDFRIGGDARAFFASCDHRPEDFLGIDFRAAAKSDYWWPHLRACDARGHLCVFPVLRLSRAAVELCFQKRQAQSGRWSRRALWPNDEGFVATTVVQAGLQAADFRVVDSDLYSSETFTVNGQVFKDVSAEGPPRLYHPVRAAERPAAPRSRRARLEDADNLLFRVRAAALRRLNARIPW